jgi:hypothetical protein
LDLPKDRLYRHAVSSPTNSVEQPLSPEELDELLLGMVPALSAAQTLNSCIDVLAQFPNRTLAQVVVHLSIGGERPSAKAVAPRGNLGVEWEQFLKAAFHYGTDRSPNPEPLAGSAGEPIRDEVGNVVTTTLPAYLADPKIVAFIDRVREGFVQIRRDDQRAAAERGVSEVARVQWWLQRQPAARLPIRPASSALTTEKVIELADLLIADVAEASEREREWRQAAARQVGDSAPGDPRIAGTDQINAISTVTSRWAEANSDHQTQLTRIRETCAAIGSISRAQVAAVISLRLSDQESVVSRGVLGHLARLAEIGHAWLAASRLSQDQLRGAFLDRNGCLPPDVCDRLRRSPPGAFMKAVHEMEPLWHFAFFRGWHVVTARQLNPRSASWACRHRAGSGSGSSRNCGTRSPFFSLS